MLNTSPRAPLIAALTILVRPSLSHPAVSRRRYAEDVGLRICRCCGLGRFYRYIQPIIVKVVTYVPLPVVSAAIDVYDIAPSERSYIAASWRGYSNISYANFMPMAPAERLQRMHDLWVRFVVKEITILEHLVIFALNTVHPELISNTRMSNTLLQDTMTIAPVSYPSQQRIINGCLVGIIAIRHV